MPKFAPNTGFKMPGVGSKNIDSPGNFRDEQHVDKVGYCDTTEDRMLPEGSSPLKARYTQSGYLKDLDAISIPKSGCPKGYTAVDGKCVAKPEKEKKVKVKKRDGKKELEKTNKNAKKAFGGANLTVKAKALPAEKLETGKETQDVTRRDTTEFTKEGTEAYNKLTKKQQKDQDARERKRLKDSERTVTQERNYNIVNGKKVYIGGFKDKT
tara:strand:+ start:348 stop:980 length:633 start_codon:yes stop_codon:yes gene_type:complete